MFDVGFSELCLIGLVTLLVIGPERLPKVARLAGFWLGKARSIAASVKEEIKLEFQAEEMRQIFKEQSDLQNELMDALVPPRVDVMVPMKEDGKDPEDSLPMVSDATHSMDARSKATYGAVADKLPRA